MNPAPAFPLTPDRAFDGPAFGPLSPQQIALASKAQGRLKRQGHRMEHFRKVYGAPLLRSECTDCHQRVVLDLETEQLVGEAAENRCDRHDAETVLTRVRARRLRFQAQEAGS